MKNYPPGVTGFEPQINPPVPKVREVHAEGVWCCTERHKCKWQCFALHKGLAWGMIPPPSNPWRQRHDDGRCPGTLVQLLERA